MSEMGYNVVVEADDDRDDGIAAEVARILLEAYPGHPWHVRVAKGLIIIKHMKMSSKWGMSRHYDRVAFDAKVLRREVVMAAGEFLERANLRRGQARAGERITRIDGIPERDRIIH